MSNPPGQEPRPGFTPRADQGRPGGRGGSGRPDDGYRRDDSGRRRPPPDRDADEYWTGGRQAAARPPGSSQQWRDPGYRDPRDQPARRPDDRYRNSGPRPDRPRQDEARQDGRDRDDRWSGADRRESRGGYRDGAPTFVSRNGPATAKTGATTGATGVPGARPGPFSTPGLRWVGAWRGWTAALVLVAVALVGLVGTIIIGHDPGFLIGVSLVVGSVVAAIGAQRRAVHQLIPLPALSYLVISTVAGTANDWSNLDDSKEFATSFLTWIGGGFVGLVAATVLVVLITFVRWLGSKLLVSGQFGDAASGAGRPAPDGGRRDERTASAPRADRGQRDRAPSGNAFGERGPRARDDRAPRPDRPPRDGWDRNGRDWDGSETWGGSAPGDFRSAPNRSAPNRGAPNRGAPNRGAANGSAANRSAANRSAANPSAANPSAPDDRDTRPPRDVTRRPRPTDSGPRDLW